MLVYPAGLDVSTRHLTLLTNALRGRRAQLGTRWRKLTAERQALLVLAWLRKNETYTALAGGFRVGVATVYRYLREALEVLAALAPTLAQALDVARRKVLVILDGTLVRTDRVRARRRGADAAFYYGKIRAHGMNVQVLAGASGELLWASPALPGARHDLTAAGTTAYPGVDRPRPDRGAADKGYQGAGPAISVPFRPRRKHPDTGTYLPLSANQKACNAAHAKLRAPGERANAQLKSWRVLTRLRRSPETTTATVQAVTALITTG